MNLSNVTQYASVEGVRQLHESYEYHLSALAVLAGFTIDSLTLRRVDLWAEHIVVLTYLAIAAVAILVMHLYNEGKLDWQLFAEAEWWVPLVMQFAFGGLFSVFLLFYGRASSVAANWPFLLILVGLLVGNEFFRRQYQRLTFNITVWYTAVLAYCILAVPLLVNQIGDWVFILSGLLSLVIVAGFIWLLKTVSSQIITLLQRTFSISIGVIFLLTGLLYFTQAIPPIPLSLKEAQVAHQVQKTGSQNYQITVEDRSWYQSFTPKEVMHTNPGQPIYFFSAVFAPTEFDTQITHRWQYRKADRWVTASRISFPVIGGRAKGYRGYSRKQNLSPGLWRVVVETQGGRRLGQDSFRIEFTDRLSEYRTIIR